MSGFISFEFILFVRWASDFRVIVERKIRSGYNATTTILTSAKAQRL
ncbi:hypothetical protein OROHE_006709 [Orobanche hederae]